MRLAEYFDDFPKGYIAMLNEKAKEYHDGFKVVSPLGSNPDGTGYTVIIE